MEHTFLFQEGEWTANGIHSDEQGRQHPANGITKITHDGRQWINAGSITMLAATGLVVRENRYVIAPLAEEQDCTSIRSENPELGTLVGRLVIIRDTILWACASKDGSIVAVESLRKVSDTVYENRGFLLKGGEKAAAWDFELQREE